MKENYEIEVMQAYEMMQGVGDYKFFDIRDQKDYDKFHAKCSQNVDVESFSEYFERNSIDHSAPVFVICYFGVLSKVIVNFLRTQDIVAYSIKGGIRKWESDNLPMERNEYSEDIYTEKVSGDSGISQSLATSQLEMMGEVTAGIIHEINNPLAIIVGYAERLSNKINEHEQSPEFLKFIEEIKLDSFVDHINRATSLMQSTIKNIKNISHLNSIEELEDFTIDQFVSDLESMISFKTKIVPIEIVLDDFCQGVTICSNKSMVLQVLMNLVGNSVHAIEKLEDQWIKINVMQLDQENKIRFEVIDSGNGIRQDHLDKVFRKFYTTKEKSKGTGLGLHLSKQIANKLGGDLFVDSSKSNTSFVFEININDDIKLSKAQ